jgi:hypothetical protein
MLLFLSRDLVLQKNNWPGNDMTYSDHFRLADDYLAHIDPVISSIADPFIQSRYTGFLAVSAVTVYELAIKNIFYEFARTKHIVLANFTEAFFGRLNGRIKTSDLMDNYVKKFGEKYRRRLSSRLDNKEKEILRKEKASIRTCYGNVITWRNTFAHEGVLPINATYEEVKRSYNYGKLVIDCLAETMRR